MATLNLGDSTVGTTARGRWAAPHVDATTGTPIEEQPSRSSTTPFETLRLGPAAGSGNKLRAGGRIEGIATKPVEVEALVLIKIMRHCREYFPTPVNGLLLGLDDNKMEVTDCFGLQNKRDLWNQLSKEKLDPKEVDEKVVLEDVRYQVKMLEQLNLVNADCCNVGWYQSLQFDDLRDPSIFEGLCEHQELVEDAVGIGFDPLLAPLGLQAFKAYRVTNEVLKCRREAEQDDFSVYNSLKSHDVLVEVPLVVRNSLLIQAFLVDWLGRDPVFEHTGQFDALEEGDRAAYMQKSLDFVVNCLDELQLEQDKLMRFQKENYRQSHKQKEAAERRRLENEQRRLLNEELLPELPSTIKRGEIPSQLPTLLMANHVNRVSEKLSYVIGDNLARCVLIHKVVSRPNSVTSP